MSSSQRLVPIGRVGRPHARDGSFAVESASEASERFEVGATVYVDGEAARIVSSKRSRNRPVIRLDKEVERGSTLAVARADLPPPDADSYYVADLVGAAVEDENGRALGHVLEVSPAPANDILELDSGLLLPFVEACIRKVDVEAGRIVVAPGFDDPG